MDDEELAEQAQMTMALKEIMTALKKGDLSTALGVCESAINGEAVTYKDLALTESQRMERFAAGFNELMHKYDLRGAFVIGRVHPESKESFLINTGGDVGITALVNSWAPKDGE